MTSRPAEEVRVRSVAGRWTFGFSWLNAGTVIVAAGVSIALLFGALWFLLREKPLPRRRTDLAAPPRLSGQIAAAQERLKVNPQDIVALV